MSRLTEKIKHAFKVNEGTLEPTVAQAEVIDKVAQAVARRRLTTPALMFLELSRPLNYITAQAMHFFQPIAAIVLDTRGLELFAQFLEHRGSVDFLCRRIEHFEQEYEKK